LAPCGVPTATNEPSRVFAARADGDFARLLSGTGVPFPGAVTSVERRASHVERPALEEVHGTTVIAVKFRDGVLNVGDRRATANFAVMYDRAEKLIPLDDYTLIAVSGSFAKAVEVTRYLRHAFKYYSRSQLQEMSLDGKLSEVTRMIAQNLPNALQGFGAFLPVLSAFDRESGEGRIFFYDVMGARFETTEFGAAGSGSQQIRGAFDYVVKTRGPFREMDLDTALRECLILLDIAADLDAATGGYGKVLPTAKAVTAEGIVDLEEERMRAILREVNRGERDGL
jgi:proteasome beta subunit